MDIITLQQLLDKKACCTPLDRFQQLFGKSVKVTEELAEQVGMIFPFDWAARNLLCADRTKKYLDQLAAFKEANFWNGNGSVQMVRNHKFGAVLFARLYIEQEDQP
jgi:hypothetical protein